MPLVAPMKLPAFARSAITLLELLIVIALLAIVIFLVPPLISNRVEKHAQLTALQNAKSIALALRLYASDHNGNLPSFTLQNGKPTTIPVTDSNTAFAQLFPTYVQTEEVFWLKNSAFCSPAPPDEIEDNPPLDTPVNTLKSGENEWGYAFYYKHIVGILFVAKGSKTIMLAPLMAD